MSQPPFSVLIIGQAGRLQYEALLFVASLRAMSPQFTGSLIVAEPQPGPLWPDDPRMYAAIKDALVEFGAEVVPFDSEHFGAIYPPGNKIEALALLPLSQPFLFFDSDTLITGELTDIAFDFTRPAASMKRSNSWPKEDLYWPGYHAVWKSLYDRFGLDFTSSLDTSHPEEHWKRYLYFNAGWFLGADPQTFGARFIEYATSIRDAPPPELAAQTLDPWLDQVALPLVVHSFSGGRPGPELAGLDGDVTCHYRAFPLLYATGSDHAISVLHEVTAPNRLKKLLKEHVPLRRMVYNKRGLLARALFDRAALPPSETQIRRRLRQDGLWLR